MYWNKQTGIGTDTDMSISQYRYPPILASIGLTLTMCHIVDMVWINVVLRPQCWPTKWHWHANRTCLPTRHQQTDSEYAECFVFLNPQILAFFFSSARCPYNVYLYCDVTYEMISWGSVVLFTPFNAMLAWYLLRPHVRVCVSVSATSRCYTKTARHRIKLTVPHNSLGTLVTARRYASAVYAMGLCPCPWCVHAVSVKQQLQMSECS